jgi:FMN phosphatase YigB (HAD superfamily)
MSKKVAVFDLDGTIGDFMSVDYFSYIYDIETILSDNNSKIHRKKLKEEYKTYDDETLKFLKELKETFEDKMIKEGFTQLLLRPNIVEIIRLLKKEVKDFLIYSNNGNLYNLEFAGRAIENMTYNPGLFKAYMHRSDSIRDEFDGMLTGSRLKTVKTIKKAVKRFLNYEPSRIIFFDDIVHPDLMYNMDVNYVNVNRFDANLTEDKLEKIFLLFESVLYDMFKKYKNMGSKFFNLYHIKEYLRIGSIEDLEQVYLMHSKIDYRTVPFKNDYELIKTRIEEFNKLKEGGKRKRKTKKIKKPI